MKKQILLAAVAFAVLALTSQVTMAGDPAGACLATLAEFDKPVTEGGEVAYFCTEDLDSSECEEFCGETANPEGGLLVIGCDFAQNETCQFWADEFGVAWDGACVLTGNFPTGEICGEIQESIPGWTSQTVCEGGDGEWQGDGSTCGDPVPAMPGAGRAALIIVLMFGALAILNFSGILRSA